MSLNDAIGNLQAKAMSLSGMRAAPNAPTESANVFPFAVSYERSGRLVVRSASFGDDLATIYTELHVSRQLLPRAIEQAMSMRDAFLKQLIADPTLGGSVSCVIEVRRTFGRLEWNGAETIGYRFEVDVKVPLV